jgi:hypothetical protein
MDFWIRTSLRTFYGQIFVIFRNAFRDLGDSYVYALRNAFFTAQNASRYKIIKLILDVTEIAINRL